MTIPEARVLGGRYEMGTPLGHGGMAEVFSGVDVRLGRDVAIKVLRSDLARDPSFLARFRREAQAAASLNAPTIVSVFDTGTDDHGVPFIVMERVEGRTLREVLEAEGRLLPRRALEITADICLALDAAHAAGIVHRDIKPANVMLTRSGQVKVMDFGIARAAADSAAGLTQTAAVTGTAAYLSPEQAQGAPVDARSDLYSTGCVLYELVTGRAPFTGDNPVAVAYQHVREDPEPPSAHDDTLPADVDAVVLKAMSKNPANRYQSAQEMRADLLRARSGDTVQATPLITPPVYIAPTVVGSLRADYVRADYGPRDYASSSKRALAYGAFGLLLLGLMIALALLVRSILGTDSGLFPAPGLIGLKQEEAVSRLAQEGLRLGRVETAFDEKPFGTVLKQSPDQGILVPENGSISIVVSKGIEMTVVPVEVIGKSKEEAVGVLTKSKLTVRQEVPRDGNIPPGTVLEISPPPGSQVRAGSDVVLTVATGQTQVPGVLRKTRSQAVSELQKAGFSVGIELRDAPGPPEIVLSQTPPGGLAPRGSAVILVVSQVPPPPPPPPSPSPSPLPPAPPSPEPTESASPPPLLVPNPPPRPTVSPTPSPT